MFSPTVPGAVHIIGTPSSCQSTSSLQEVVTLTLTLICRLKMATLGGDELPPMDPTSTNTPIPEPDMSLDSNTPSALSKLNVFVIVVPVLLATGIIIWGTLVLLGIIQRRRHLRSVSAWSSTRGGEKARVSLLKKPVLLDVRLPYTSHASSTERVHVSYIYTCLPHVADDTSLYPSNF